MGELEFGRELILMRPQIVVISGPFQGAVYKLEAKEFSIGRELSNHLSVDDISLSRWHCTIEQEEKQFKLRDLGSHNGTYINGLPVIERILKHGDYIKAGNSLFRFLLKETEIEAVTAEVQLEDKDLLTGSAIRLHPEYATASMAHDLGVLMRLLFSYCVAPSSALRRATCAWSRASSSPRLSIVRCCMSGAG